MKTGLCLTGLILLTWRAVWCIKSGGAGPVEEELARDELDEAVAAAREDEDSRPDQPRVQDRKNNCRFRYRKVPNNIMLVDVV